MGALYPYSFIIWNNASLFLGVRLWIFVIGISGQGTSTYLLTDKKGQHFVLKVPNDSEKYTDWLKGQECAEKLCKQYVGEYQGTIHIPKTIQTRCL